MENEIIELISVEKKTDKDGFEITEETSFEVFAEIKSVKYTEFYQAQRDGINVQIVAVVNADDMAAATTEKDGKKVKPEYVRYDGELYKIVRRYVTSKTKVELTLQEVE